MKLALHVQPGAKKSEVTGWHGDRIKLRVHAPPVDGAANEAVIEFLASSLGLPRSQVRLVQGASSRSKLVEIQGLSEGALQSWLAKLPGGPKPGGANPR